MQCPSHLQSSSSPPFPINFLCICSLCQVFISSFFHMISLCTPHQFILRTFLHSNLHSHFIHFLLSAPMIILISLFLKLLVERQRHIIYVIYVKVLFDQSKCLHVGICHGHCQQVWESSVRNVVTGCTLVLCRRFGFVSLVMSPFSLTF